MTVAKDMVIGWFTFKEFIEEGRYMCRFSIFSLEWYSLHNLIRGVRFVYGSCSFDIILSKWVEVSSQLNHKKIAAKCFKTYFKIYHFVCTCLRYVQTVEVDYRSDKCVTGIGIGKTLFGLRLRIILSAQQTLVVRVISSV